MARVVEKRWESAFSGLTRAERSPCRYAAYVPDLLGELIVALPPEVAADVGDTERAILRLNNAGPFATTLDSIARLLLRAEAVASSRIEGLVIGARRLLRVEVARDLGEPVQDLTAEAVLGNIEALALAVGEVATLPLVTLPDLLNVHAALMRHTDRPDLGGKLRTIQNWIGGNNDNPCGAAFVPPPPELVPELMDDLIAFLNRDQYPPLVQAALAHAWFETIHPFVDGNGRVGRALIHIVLKRRGLAPLYLPPISLILATRSREYVDGLSATRYLGSPAEAKAQAGLLQWIVTFTVAARQATNGAQDFSRRIEALVETWRTRVGPVRADSAVAQLLPKLPQAPILTVATAAKLIERSEVATNQAIARLVDAGVLAQTTVGRRNRVYEAVGLLDLVTSFERAMASPTGDTRDAPPVRPVPQRPR